MKKSFFYAICVMVVATTVAVMSCQKEKEPQAEAEVPQADAQMQAEIDRIVGFKKQVETRKANPGMKSAETVTLDEAMNNIVDLFNVTYTEPMAYYTESERHEFTLNVALTADGKVLLDDVVAAYEQALANAREAYHGSTLPDKAYQRLMVTCTPQRDGTADLKFDGKYGTRTDQPLPEPPTPNPHHLGPFHQGVWHYLDGMGSCDEVHFRGADKVLEDTLMKEVRSKWPADPLGCRGFYTHFVKCDFSGGPNYPDVFYSTDVENTCIEWQYMNDYLYGEKRNIYQVLPQSLGINLNGNSMQLYRYYVTNVVIEGQGDVEIGPIYHWTEVEYGRYNFIDYGTIERDEL